MRARIRDGKDLEPFPSKNMWKRFLDYIMYGVGILAPLALVPQISQLYTTKSGEGLSLLTWSLLTIFNILWALYGAVHKDNHIFFANIFMILFNLAIVIGILLY